MFFIGVCGLLGTLLSVACGMHRYGVEIFKTNQHSQNKISLKVIGFTYKPKQIEIAFRWSWPKSPLEWRIRPRSTKSDFRRSENRATVLQNRTVWKMRFTKYPKLKFEKALKFSKTTKGENKKIQKTKIKKRIFRFVGDQSKTEFQFVLYEKPVTFITLPFLLFWFCPDRWGS